MLLAITYVQAGRTNVQEILYDYKAGRLESITYDNPTF